MADPLVLDTRDLPRRPGNQRELSLDVATPSQMGEGVIVVAKGAPMHLEVRLESVVEGVLVTAEADTTMSGECGHCLEDVSGPLSVDICELFLYPEETPGGRVVERTPEELEEAEEEGLEQLVDDKADLEPALTDAIVLALPFSRLCGEDCPRLAETRKLLAEPEPLDPRWAGLAALRAEIALPDED